ncbi:MAG: YjbH domain-containing protein [Candidatus Edwardsbacteria bacterium]|nr:YjbH domain-containing protein [Candidatus Edwardsbacteria bacterium]
MKKIILLLTVAVLVCSTGHAIQFTETVDLPTAGTLNRGSYDIHLRMQPVGGLLLGFSVGLFDRLNFGFSYGGDKLIGYGTIDWNPQPGFQIKYRIFDESYYGPGVALGFDNQGFGYWSGNRYLNKSRGFYAAAGKNYKFLGTLAFHGGVSYSLEDRHNPDNTLDAWAGIEKSLNDELWLVAEYDAALNDKIKDGQFGEGYGYLNLGMRWLFGSRLMLEADLKNLMRNGERDTPAGMIGRTVKIAYFDSF